MALYDFATAPQIQSINQLIHKNIRKRRQIRDTNDKQES